MQSYHMPDSVSSGGNPDTPVRNMHDDSEVRR